MSLFVSLFDDKLVDNRDPWISGIHVPSIDGSFTLFAPELGPWIQLAAVRHQNEDKNTLLLIGQQPSWDSQLLLP